MVWGARGGCMVRKWKWSSLTDSPPDRVAFRVLEMVCGGSLGFSRFLMLFLSYKNPVDLSKPWKPLIQSFGVYCPVIIKKEP